MVLTTVVSLEVSDSTVAARSIFTRLVTVAPLGVVVDHRKSGWGSVGSYVRATSPLRLVAPSSVVSPVAGSTA